MEAQDTGCGPDPLVGSRAAHASGAGAPEADERREEAGAVAGAVDAGRHGEQHGADAPLGEAGHGLRHDVARVLLDGGVHGGVARGPDADPDERLARAGQRAVDVEHHSADDTPVRPTLALRPPQQDAAAAEGTKHDTALPVHQAGRHGPLPHPRHERPAAAGIAATHRDAWSGRSGRHATARRRRRGVTRQPARAARRLRRRPSRAPPPGQRRGAFPDDLRIRPLNEAEAHLLADLGHRKIRLVCSGDVHLLKVSALRSPSLSDAMHSTRSGQEPRADRQQERGSAVAGCRLGPRRASPRPAHVRQPAAHGTRRRAPARRARDGHPVESRRLTGPAAAAGACRRRGREA